jgi:hypothetical protein
MVNATQPRAVNDATAARKFDLPMSVGTEISHVVMKTGTAHATSR